MKTHRLIFFLCLTAIVAIAAMAGKPRPSQWDRDARLRKAEYILVESEPNRMADQDGLYGRLIYRAADLAPADSYIDMLLGQWQMLWYGQDSVLSTMGLQRIHDYYIENPDDYWTGSMLAQIYRQIREPELSFDIARRLYRQFPTRRSVQLNMAQSYLNRGDSLSLDSAFAIYRRMQLESSELLDPDITEGILKTFMLRGDTASVVGELTRLYRERPTDQSTAYLVAALLLQIDQADTARFFVERAKALDPENTNNLFMEMEYYSAIGDSTAYEEVVKSAVTNDNVDPSIRYSLLRNHLANVAGDDESRTDEIISMMRSAADLTDSDSKERYDLARILGSLGRYSEAADLFGYMAALHPDDLSRQLVYGQSLLAANRTADAIEALKTVEANHPGNLDLTHMLASAYYINKQVPMAIEVMQTINADTISDYKTKAFYYEALGEFYHQDDQPEVAGEYYRKAIELDPTNAMSLNNYAYVLACHGSADDLTLAQKYAEMAMRHEATPTVYDTYAWVLYKQHNYGKAAEVMTEVLGMLNFAPSDIKIVEVAQRTGLDTISSADRIEQLIQDKKLTIEYLQGIVSNYELDLEPFGGLYQEDNLLIAEDLSIPSNQPDPEADTDDEEGKDAAEEEEEITKLYLTMMLQSFYDDYRLIQSNSTLYDHMGDIFIAVDRPEVAALMWQLALIGEADSADIKAKLDNVNKRLAPKRPGASKKSKK